MNPARQAMHGRLIIAADQEQMGSIEVWGCGGECPQLDGNLLPGSLVEDRRRASRKGSDRDETLQYPHVDWADPARRVARQALERRQAGPGWDQYDPRRRGGQRLIPVFIGTKEESLVLLDRPAQLSSEAVPVVARLVAPLGSIRPGKVVERVEMAILAVPPTGTVKIIGAGPRGRDELPCRRVPKLGVELIGEQREFLH